MKINYNITLGLNKLNIDELVERYENLKSDCENPTYAAFRDCQRFIDRILALENYEELAGAYPELLSQIINGARRLQSSTLPRFAHSVLDYANRSIIHSTSTRDRILRDINEVSEWIDRYGDESLMKLLHNIRKKCAIYRAKRKYSDALIASAGNNANKHDKLLSEANEMLRQDWREIFGVDPPDIHIVINI